MDATQEQRLVVLMNDHNEPYVLNAKQKTREPDPSSATSTRPELYTIQSYSASNGDTTIVPDVKYLLRGM